MTLFYLKFCERPEYAEDFLDGNLYLNALKQFRDTEEAADGRGDDQEGVFLATAPHPGLILEIGGVRIDPADLTRSVLFYGCAELNMNVLCLYAGSTGTFDVGGNADGSLDLTKVDMDAFLEHLRVPDECLSMGAHTVIVHKVSEFRRRLVAAAQKAGARVEYKPVNYLPPDHSGRRHPVFDKPSRYAWQREHRFLFDFGRNEEIAGPVRLSVGSLRDICGILDPASINGNLDFRPAATPPAP